MSQPPDKQDQQQYDVLIIGSGAAGLSLALRLSSSLAVAVLAKAPLSEGSTRYAQGGISAVLDPTDSVQSHASDTLNTGGILCEEDVVRFTAARGKQQIDWLLKLGMDFTRNEHTDGQHEFHLTQEGGHSRRRVIHSADTTGRSLSDTLIGQVRKQSNITLFEHHIAIDLITCRPCSSKDSQICGAYVLDRQSDTVDVFRANKVVLATGGASKVYLYTSNPDVSTGDGIAMAWRAGCRIANMEFIQFHPTCLYHHNAKSFLLSEAIRGEGGRLLLPDGAPFMQDIDPRAELAPRDIVARAIDNEMKRRGLDHVLLDISHKPADFIKKHFPNIYQRCLKFGYDMTCQALPVVPAAHYTCGGVITDKYGKTDVSGLYAIGETAHTGLHGANRMASNSLLECLVFAESTAQEINRESGTGAVPVHLPEWDESRVTHSDEQIVVSHNWDELRRFMWDYVGIVRTDKRLERALRRVELLEREIDEYYSNFRVSNDLIELRNLVLVAHLIIRSAMLRKESRGLHYTLDYPQADNSKVPEDTILTPRRYLSEFGFRTEIQYPAEPAFPSEDEPATV